jgi:hypothetical protein
MNTNTVKTVTAYALVAADLFVGASMAKLSVDANNASKFLRASRSNTEQVASGFVSTGSLSDSTPIGGSVPCGTFASKVTNFGQANQDGDSPVALAIYHNGVLVENISLLPSCMSSYTVGGDTVAITVKNAFVGLYPSEDHTSLQMAANMTQYQSSVVVNPDMVTAANKESSTSKEDAAGAIALFATAIIGGVSYTFAVSTKGKNA